MYLDVVFVAYFENRHVMNFNALKN